MTTSDRVYQIVRQIPRGKVLTYKKLAALAGVKNPRVVGNILHKNVDPQGIPCHRVVNSFGKLAKNYAFGGTHGQAKKLKQEKIEIRNNKVDLKIYLWK